MFIEVSVSASMITIIISSLKIGVQLSNKIFFPYPISTLHTSTLRDHRLVQHRLSKLTSLLPHIVRRPSSALVREKAKDLDKIRV